jgi:hypothetical protein
MSLDAWVPLVTREFDKLALYSKPFSADDVKVCELQHRVEAVCSYSHTMPL